MNITISIIENNERRGNLANINGVRVEVEGATIAGSDKQVAWATQIMEDTLRQAARSALQRLGVHFDRLNDAAALDAAVEKVNGMMSILAGRLANTSAARWIDNRNLHPRMLLDLVTEG